MWKLNCKYMDYIKIMLTLKCSYSIFFIFNTLIYILFMIVILFMFS